MSFQVCFADFAFRDCNFTTSCDLGDQPCLESENRAQKQQKWVCPYGQC